jgi:SAM-dependent methyltransferase
MNKFFKKIFIYFSDKYYLKRQADAKFNPVIFYSLKSANPLLRVITSFFPLELRKKFSNLVMSSRIVEEPFVLQNIGLERGSKILDIGCAYSKISLELASLGYQLTGIDLNDYPYTHPNFRFLKGNFLENKFLDSSLDGVIALSTLEHIGIDCYGGPLLEEGDKKAVKEIYRILKPGGKFILTLPFGKRKIMPGQRVYDMESLDDLLNDFAREKEEFYEYNNDAWLPQKRELIATIDFSEKHQAVALVVCLKP